MLVHVSSFKYLVRLNFRDEIKKEPITIEKCCAILSLNSHSIKNQLRFAFAAGSAGYIRAWALE